MSITFFKAKIKFGGAPIAGKQSTFDHNPAGQFVKLNAQKYSSRSQQNLEIH